MRAFSVVPFILSLVLVSSAFATQKPGARAPAKTPDRPVERIEHMYLDTEVLIDGINQFAIDKHGIPINGTVQSFYPNGRLAWETQWIEGKLHGITRGYHENRRLREETTWVDGKMHGLARWYDETGKLLREAVYENGVDPSAPAASAGQGEDAGRQ